VAVWLASTAADGCRPKKKKVPHWVSTNKSDLSCWGFLGLMMGGKDHSTFANSALVYSIVIFIFIF
jgi:hypothetical protein